MATAVELPTSAVVADQYPAAAAEIEESIEAPKESIATTGGDSCISATEEETATEAGEEAAAATPPEVETPAGERACANEKVVTAAEEETPDEAAPAVAEEAEDGAKVVELDRAVDAPADIETAAPEITCTSPEEEAGAIKAVAEEEAAPPAAAASGEEPVISTEPEETPAVDAPAPTEIDAVGSE